jgi:hypothetical protein
MKRRVVFAVCNSSARHIFVVNREALFIICNRPNVFASPVCGPARVNNPAARRGIRVPYVVYSYSRKSAATPNRQSNAGPRATQIR